MAPVTRQLLGPLILMCTLCGGASAAALNHGDELLVQLPGTAISRTEFEVSLQAWRDRFPAAPVSNSDFLNLLIRLHQLALVARDNGLHLGPEFRSSMLRYTAKSAARGWLQIDIENRKLREAYDRQQYVVHASQLLVALPSLADDTQTVALQRILRLRGKLLGERASFAALARRESDDPSAQENAGSLGYFSVFDHIYALETVAYRTPVGAISTPVRSRFGYHLLRVNSRQRIGGLKQVAHILIRHETAGAKLRIERLRQELNSADFAALAIRNSQDYKTSVKGGDLGTDRLLDRLETVKLALPVGATSAPFQSSLGWHILKVTALVPFRSFTRMRPILREKLKLDDRVQRELEMIHAAPDPMLIESAVINAYANDQLCRLILMQSSAFTLLADARRNQLIAQLMNRRLPPNLQQKTAQYPAQIDHRVLRLIDE